MDYCQKVGKFADGGFRTLPRLFGYVKSAIPYRWSPSIDGSEHSNSDPLVLAGPIESQSPGWGCFFTCRRSGRNTVDGVWSHLHTVAGNVGHTIDCEWGRPS